MQIEIQTRQFSLTDAMRIHILRRLGFALGNRHLDIDRISVKLSDVNGPRGGLDKRCLIHIVLPRLKSVIVEYIEVDMYVAIDRAAEKATRAVARRLDKQRGKTRALFLFNRQHPYSLESMESC